MGKEIKADQKVADVKIIMLTSVTLSSESKTQINNRIEVYLNKPIRQSELFIALLLSSVVFFAVEIEKWWFRKKN